jgi:hypothetical protein
MPPDDERIDRIQREIRADIERTKADIIALFKQHTADMHKIIDELRQHDERRIEDLRRRLGLRDVGVRRTLM